MHQAGAVGPLRTRIVLAVMLAIAGCGGSPKVPQRPAPPPPPPAPDCQATISGVVDRMLNQQLGTMTPDERQQSEGAIREMVAHMQAAMIASCTQDQWSADARTCMNAAKTDAEMDACAEKLTPAQKDHVEKAVAQAAGDSEDKDRADPPPPPPDDAAGSGATPATPDAVTSALPKECQEYQAAIQRLASCDKLPQQSRDALKQAYETASKSWASLPADQMGQLAAACKAGTDAIVQSGKSICGW